MAELADLIDGVVGGTIDFDDIHIFATGDRLAGVTSAAGIAIGGAVGTVDGLGEDAGGRGFSNAARAGEEEGMGDAVREDGVFEGLRDGFLAHEFIEGLGAITPGEDCIGGGHAGGIIAEGWEEG